MVTPSISLRSVNADLHNHLMTDPSESLPGFDYVIDHAQEVLGEGGVIGLVNFSHTDHQDRRYERFVKSRGYKRIDLGNAVYVPEKDILVVKGQEVPISEFGKEMHLLVLGLLGGIHLPAGLGLERTVAEALDNSGILVIDHPFFMHGLGTFLQANPQIENGVLPYVGAIEVHNGKAVYGNNKAQNYFKNLRQRFPRIGAINSSDGHSLQEVGTSYSTLSMPTDYENTLKNAEQVNEALKSALRETHYASIGRKQTNYGHSLLHAAELLKVHGIKRTLKRISGDEGI